MLQTMSLFKGSNKTSHLRTTKTKFSSDSSAHHHWTACASGWYLTPVKAFDTGTLAVPMSCPAHVGS